VDGTREKKNREIEEWSTQKEKRPTYCIFAKKTEKTKKIIKSTGNFQPATEKKI